nr:hypothetical protein [Planctomycetales bacterium]
MRETGRLVQAHFRLGLDRQRGLSDVDTLSSQQLACFLQQLQAHFPSVLPDGPWSDQTGDSSGGDVQPQRADTLALLAGLQQVAGGDFGVRQRAIEKQPGQQLRGLSGQSRADDQLRNLR